MRKPEIDCDIYKAVMGWQKQTMSPNLSLPETIGQPLKLDNKPAQNHITHPQLSPLCRSLHSFVSHSLSSQGLILTLAMNLALRGTSV